MNDMPDSHERMIDAEREVRRLTAINERLVEENAYRQSVIDRRLRDATSDYRWAVNGEGPLAGRWKDKPHRLVYDLCVEVERLNEENARFKGLLRELEWSARLGSDRDPACPLCGQFEGVRHLKDCRIKAAIG